SHRSHMSHRSHRSPMTHRSHQTSRPARLPDLPRSLADAERVENMLQDVVRGGLAGDLAEGVQRVADVDAEKLRRLVVMPKQAVEGLGGAAEAVPLVHAREEALVGRDRLPAEE